MTAEQKTCACGCGAPVKRTFRQGHNRSAPTLAAHLWASVDKSGDCWLWQGVLSATGYGALRHHGVWRSAHRASYELAKGPVPDGLVIDHLCRVRNCVNPDHLEAVPQRVNALRSPISVASLNAAKTHCAQGHEFSPANTYRPPSRPNIRVCRACRNAQERKKRRQR